MRLSDLEKYIMLLIIIINIFHVICGLYIIHLMDLFLRAHKLIYNVG